MRHQRLFISYTCCILLFATASSHSQETGNQSVHPVKTLPEFKVDDSIDNVVTLLQKADSSLKIIFVREPGATPNQPYVTLNLKNVAASMCCRYYQNCIRLLALRWLRATFTC